MYHIVNSVSYQEDIWGSGVIAPRILNNGARWMRVVNFISRLLYPRGKSPQYSLDMRLGGTQSRPGSGGEEKKIPSPGENRTTVIQLVA
jgi:hypothetical protein